MASSIHRHIFILLVTLVTLELRPCLGQNETNAIADNTALNTLQMEPTTSFVLPTDTSAMMPMNITEIPTMTFAPSISTTSSSTRSTSPMMTLLPSPSSAAMPTPTPSPSVRVATTTVSLPPPVSSSMMDEVAPTTSTVATTSTTSTQPTTDPTAPPTGTTDSSTDGLGTEAIIGIVVAIVIVAVLLLIFGCVCFCCCISSSSKRATYDATRDRPVYVVRRWDERTEHTMNRGGSFRGSKGSVRSSIRSSISSVASFLRVSGKNRSRNNSLSRGVETHTNPTVLTVTPL